MARRPDNATKTINHRGLAWGVAAMVALVAAGVLGARLWFSACLRSAAFQTMLSRLASNELKAVGQFRPFRVTGTTLYSDGFTARGTEAAFFSTLDADQVHASFEPPTIFANAWTVRELVVQRLMIGLGADHVASPQAAATPPAAIPRGLRRLLPRRAEIAAIEVHEAGLRWDGGTLEGVALRLHPDGVAWNLEAVGGRLTTVGWPEFTLEQARLRHARSVLFVTQAVLRREAGRVTVSGEIDRRNGLALEARLEGIDAAPLLPEDWRARLHGHLAGTLRITAPLSAAGLTLTSGTLALTGARLEALPVLDQIAAFTRTRQFRTLQLTRCQARFEHQHDMLAAQDVVVEASGQLCLRGGFTVRHGQIDGQFVVGITPASLQWLPGARSKVFTEARDGYLWAPMKVSGPVAHPVEDLSPRLAAAAGQTLLEGVKDGIKNSDSLLRETTRDVLDLFLK